MPLFPGPARRPAPIPALRCNLSAHARFLTRQRASGFIRTLCTLTMLLSFPRLLLALALPIAAVADPASRPDRSAADRRVVIEDIADRLEKIYVLADVAAQMAEFLRTRAATGAYDSLSDLAALAERLTADLHALSHDGHLRVRYHADPAQVMPAWQTPAPDAAARYRRHAERSNHGFVRVEILEDNIGYLRLDEFGDPVLGGDTAAAAMRFIAHTDALIVDLRANGGGGGMGAVLATYLFGDEPVHLSDFHIRHRDETIQSWTLPFVPGPRYTNKPVFVLVGPGTASAAESFTYDLQAQKRITVVGRKTAGAANPGGFVRVSQHLAIFIPDGRPINPITGTNWEGVGIAPDVEIDPSNALEHARTLALQRIRSANTTHANRSVETDTLAAR